VADGFWLIDAITWAVWKSAFDVVDYPSAGESPKVKVRIYIINKFLFLSIYIHCRGIKLRLRFTIVILRSQNYN